MAGLGRALFQIFERGLHAFNGFDNTGALCANVKP